MATVTRKSLDSVFGATLSRRQFVKAGGALFVGFGLGGAELLKTTARRPRPPETRSIRRSPIRGLKFIPTTPS